VAFEIFGEVEIVAQGK